MRLCMAPQALEGALEAAGPVQLKAALVPVGGHTSELTPEFPPLM